MEGRFTTKNRQPQTIGCPILRGLIAKGGMKNIQLTKTPLLLLSHLFFAFSAQKSQVKPQNHLTKMSSTTYLWHISPSNPL
jgi:hypothetical protein